MMTWSFYRLRDGTFTGKRFSCPYESQLSTNIPDGCGAIAGRYQSPQRVDLETRAVIEDPDLAAQAETQRGKIQRHGLAMHRIDELERRQLRSMRELAIDPANADAAQRLAQIDREIAVLREAIRGGGQGG